MDRLILPDQEIAAIHVLANEMGAERHRVDRSGWGDPGRPFAWIEAGFGCGEVVIRASDGTRYRADAGKTDPAEIGEFIQTLLDSVEDQ